MKNTIQKIAMVGVAALGLSNVDTGKAYAGPDPFVGEMMQFVGNFCPRGWASAEGQLLPISQNTALFSLIGTQFGGDGRTTFALPDLRGRVAVGIGRGNGLTPRVAGQMGGVETVILNPAQLPVHSHIATTTSAFAVKVGTEEGSEATPSSSVILAKPAGDGFVEAGEGSTPLNAESIVGSVNVSISNAGGSQSVLNEQPFLVIRTCVALQGVFPSRS